MQPIHEMFPGLPEFSPDTYLKIGMDDLVTVSLHFLLESGKPPTFENLVALAYSLFPQRFSMVGYAQWPDSAIINKCWLRCRTDKKLISGNVASGFQLTPKGKFVTEKTLAKLLPSLEFDKDGKGKLQRKGGDRRTAAGRVVSRVEKSTAFNKYKSDGHVENVSEYELCDILYCTLESSAETLKKNYELVSQYLKEYSRDDLVKFIDMLKVKFSSKFLASKIRGGMLPKKGHC